MPGTQIAIDGLWRCLCPFFDTLAFSLLKTPLRRGASRPSIGSRKFTLSRRGWHMLPYSSSSLVKIQTQHQHKQQSRTHVQESRDTFTVWKPAQASAPLYASLDDVPIAQLHETLRNIRTESGSYDKIVELVTYLIKNRGEKPSLLHYDALIRANADAGHGSADIVGHLLREMKQEDIVPDSALYHSALQALAIHPDYLLRTEVLREMRDRWFNLTSDGWHNWIVGLLRDRQYEIALDKLEQMRQEGTRVQPWLYDIFIYLFCESEELDEALKILQFRNDNGELDISPNIWYHVLDACSSGYHYEGTLYIWRKRVEIGYLNPSDAMCTNVLNTAARHQDPNLATDVVRVLAGRTSKLDLHHYEALITAYTGSSDLKSALQILSIMKKAGLEPTDGTTRSIYTYISTGERLPADALEILRSLQREGQIIPTAAVNVVLEASVSQGHLQGAVEQYKALHTICPNGPNTSTFNNLLKGCAKTIGNKDLAMFLASEMAALGVRPNVMTYDRLVLTCLMEDDYEDAFRYMDEMKKTFGNSDLRIGTLHALVKKCIAAGDERAWSLLKESEGKGRSRGKLRSWAEEAWGKAPKRIGQPEDAEEDIVDAEYQAIM